MLPYERRVVEALLTSDDPELRQEVVAYVGATLAAMPEVLRTGLVGETILLGTWSAVRRRRSSATDATADIAWLDGHPVGLVRQWVRALRSLVLLAEQELLQARAEAAAA